MKTSTKITTGLLVILVLLVSISYPIILPFAAGIFIGPWLRKKFIGRK